MLKNYNLDKPFLTFVLISTLFDKKFGQTFDKLWGIWTNFGGIWTNLFEFGQTFFIVL